MEKAGLESMPSTLAGVIDILRRENLITGVSSLPGKDEGCFDVTRESLSFPAPRSAAMQTMARGETGGMLALAYSNMRGYGSAHPTIGELRVGYVPMEVKHPYNRGVCSVGEILMTEAQIISDIDTQDGSPKFALGYGLCFGHNETKAISMATLDRAMQVQTDETKYPSEDQEFVLQHIDGIEAMGFANHFKLPHYVTFQSALDRLRASQAKGSRVKNGKGE
jgi:alpha-D-ribose 1-methylphosphonate 5-triphosphate synthase subunit PhnI